MECLISSTCNNKISLQAAWVREMLIFGSVKEGSDQVVKFSESYAKESVFK